jgi:hypothetical protein
MGAGKAPDIFMVYGMPVTFGLNASFKPDVQPGTIAARHND